MNIEQLTKLARDMTDDELAEALKEVRKNRKKRPEKKVVKTVTSPDKTEEEISQDMQDFAEI